MCVWRDDGCVEGERGVVCEMQFGSLCVFVDVLRKGCVCVEGETRECVEKEMGV